MAMSQEVRQGCSLEIPIGGKLALCLNRLDEITFYEFIADFGCRWWNTGDSDFFTRQVYTC
jgi:hypothetical protein